MKIFLLSNNLLTSSSGFRDRYQISSSAMLYVVQVYYNKKFGSATTSFGQAFADSRVFSAHKFFVAKKEDQFHIAINIRSARWLGGYPKNACY